MSEKVVVVTNRSGYAIAIQGRRIKPLRETAEDQEFPFSSVESAQEFTDSVNNKGVIGLSALFAGDESQEPETQNVDGDESQDTEAKNYASLSITELKAQCKERGLSGYSRLKEPELIELLTQNPLVESSDGN